MNPILQAALGSILRWVLAIGAGYIVKAGIWTDNDAQTYVLAGSMAILALAWSQWEKYKSRVKFLTALATPYGTTENILNWKLVYGIQAPSVWTPSDTVPVLPKYPDQS